MTIGLLSPHLSQNYGTVLQALALAKSILNMGVECEYIDCGLYRPSRINDKLWPILYPIFHPKYKRIVDENKKVNSKDLDYSFLCLPDFRKIFNINQSFVEKNIPVRKEWVNMYNLDQLPYDRFIVGSDQTWNPDAIYQYSPYYLRQIKDNNRKYSYACSMSRTTNFSKDFVNFLKENLCSFSALSCREKSNSELLQKLLGKEVSWVLDPTLLLSREEWLPYMAPVEIPDKYIVCYILGERKCIGEYADKLGCKMNLPVYYIMTRPSSCGHAHVLKNIGAAEFLWLIDNCQYLVTDSFHGCAFSINFRKNMIAFNKFDGNLYDNDRIVDVLRSFGIEDHFMEGKDFRIVDDINYSKVHHILGERRNFSRDFLYKIVKE